MRSERKSAALAFAVTVAVAVALVACEHAEGRADGGVGGTGGAAAGGGTGGAAGAGGGAGGAAGAATCTDLSRAEPGLNDFDFRAVGSGFEAWEGETARAVVIFSGTIGHDGAYALGQTTIRNGAFEIALPKTISPYNAYALYIDKGKDDACTLDVDPFWQWVVGGVFEGVNWELTPETRSLTGLPACTINGLLDLTQPLHCP